MHLMTEKRFSAEIKTTKTNKCLKMLEIDFQKSYNDLVRKITRSFFMQREERIILHSDLNNFYATCECLLHPELQGKPVVVCGKVENRHGVVLAKNNIAKQAGIKTGMTLYEARTILSDIVAVEAHHSLYYEYSKRVKQIYLEYTDKVESFGIDEAWLDVSESQNFFESAEQLAYQIKERIKTEIGLTVSIGVSFNKIFAKLGSDMKKPDAVTVITRDNFKEKIWKLPACEMLMVGKSLKNKLYELGIETIGDLANFDLKFLKAKFGKWGETLWNYANGRDVSVVKKFGEQEEIKSVGNSLTYYRDLKTSKEVEPLLFMLAESVATRMRAYGVGMARTVRLYVVDNDMQSFVRQAKLLHASDNSSDIASGAFALFEKNFDWRTRVRGVGITATDFVKEEQLSFDCEQMQKEKDKSIDVTVDKLRSRFGHNIINRGFVLTDPKLEEMNINGANISGTNLDLKSSADLGIIDYPI